MTDPQELEARVEAALRGEEGDPLALLAEVYERYRTQTHLLDRLTHISDRFQRAERERGQTYAEHYQRKVRQIEKIVRISDQYQSMLRDLNERLHRTAIQDELTGLPNRRYMRDRVEQEVAHGARGAPPASLALADIDRFKAVNDTWGHAMGDTVLVHAARAMQAGMREYDVCARWGGEEFLMLFPGCGGEHAAQLADRIRGLVGSEGVAGSAVPAVSLSIGVTEIRPGDTIDEALRRADTALYQAKETGRNRVVLL
jgi:diguanylate cyclase (GGDEF)-like protein